MATVETLIEIGRGTGCWLTGGKGNGEGIRIGGSGKRQEAGVAMGEGGRD